MIIILNGMLGTNIQNIARQLSLVLNNKETNEIPDIFENLILEDNNFLIKYDDEDFSNPFHTTDKEVKDYSKNEEKIKKYYSIIKKYTQIEDLNTSLSNSYDFDLGFKNHPDVLLFNEYPNIENIFKKFKSLKNDLKYYVICGQIGKYGITQLKEYFKNEEIKVFNITMNPVLSESISKIKYPEIRNRFYYYDVHNAIILKNEKNIETIKFENILLNKGLILNKNLIKLFKIDDESKNIEINYNLNNIYSNVDFFPIWLEDGDIDVFTREYLKYNDKLPNLVKNSLKELNYEILK